MPACATLTAVPKVVHRLLVALVVVLGLCLAVVVAWVVDLRAHDDEVVRNVELAGMEVGGKTRPQVERLVEGMAREFEGARIRVAAPGGGFETHAATLGVAVSEPATVEALFDIGRSGAAIPRLIGWASSLVTPRDAELRVRVDAGAVYRAVRENDPGPRKEPTEPRLTWKDGDYEVVDGKNGRGIDAADVIKALPDAAARGEPFVVTVERGDVEPRWSEDDVAALAKRAEMLVDAPVQIRAGDAAVRVTVTTARSWVRSEATDAGLSLVLDDKATLAGVADLLKDAGTGATETRFAVEGGAVQIIPGKAGTKCCAESAVPRLERVLLADGGSGAGGETEGPVELPLTRREPSITEEEARELKIAEPVGTFTTKHKAGEPRVQNIHRIADLIRGTVILPGKSFSVNGTVGKRTKDKGFVAAPVIEEGRFSEDVGGGISQFATTLFNASFFAGLDFGEYQSHSIYISRYPYGREATLSYPHPDLVIKNPTPYGVLVWPTYTADSITVTLYSTKYADSTQSGQSKAPRGNCTRVTTERTRTYLDGRTEVDKVFATYRPKEGVNC